MDFSKFRGSGDLSDITVTIQGHEHKLHKFPFYARSDYFCEMARSKPEGESEHEHLELDDFPGGNETFEQVADFCYNMPLEITKANVVALRCAAEYLKMFGPGNLTEKADKYLASTVASAKLVKATTAIVGLLENCNAIGDVAQCIGIVDMLSEALVDCWKKSVTTCSASSYKAAADNKASLQTGSSVGSAFTRVSSVIGQKSADRLDQASIESLTSLRAEWVACILAKARASGISCEALGNLAVRYITCALGITSSASAESVPQASENELAQEKETDAQSPSSTTQNENLKNGISTTAQSVVSKGAASNTSNLAKSVPSKGAASNTSNLAKSVASKGAASITSNLAKSVASKGTASATSTVASDVGRILDLIVLTLPEQAFNIPVVTMDWLTKVLRVATAQSCACRGHLVRVAGEMLTRLDPEDLCVISPSVLHDIVTDQDQDQDQNQDQGLGQSRTTVGESEGEGDAEGEREESVVGDGQTKPASSRTVSFGPVKTAGPAGLSGERACRLVDTYMSQMMAKGVLTSETFKLLSSATKKYPRPSHDSLFEVLLFVIKSEKDTLTPEAKSDLTEQINFDLLTETSLKQALNEDVIPVQAVAESALSLSARLRSELESVKYIAEMQEEDIQKYQGGTCAKQKGSGIHGKYGGRTSPPGSADNRHSSTYSERARMISSGRTDEVDHETGDRTHLDLDALHTDELALLEPLHTYPTAHNTSEHLRAAQGVLNAARHKLAIPMYTGYRPPRYSPPTVQHYQTPRSSRGVEHDISLEDELDFKFDRSFRSLDPRVRHQRMGGHGGHGGQNPANRTYFPYSNHRY